MLHKTVSKILQRKKHGKTTVQKDNIPTQKDNKHTQERGKDTPKNSKLTPKKCERARWQTAEREWFRRFQKAFRKSVQARASRDEKNSSSTEILKKSARAKTENPRGERGGRRTAQSHALQKEIKYFKNSLLKSLTFSEIEFIIILSKT